MQPSDPISQQKTIAAVILAAGASTRMGTPKQLLPYQGKSLLKRITETAISADCKPVVVVLGANDNFIHPEISNLPVAIVKNSEWQTGMSSSIRCGIQALIRVSNSVKAAVILLCDQPFVSAETINQLKITYRSTHQSIVASTYQNTVGVPALFDAKLFLELISLTQAEGAKKVIQRHIDSVATVRFPQGAIDIDTPNDYQQCRNSEYFRI
ncbi:MAG: nucleotidyltransferase family protein [Cyanobacteria bacterium P01_H01_bin.21]